MNARGVDRRTKTWSRPRLWRFLAPAAALIAFAGLLPPAAAAQPAPDGPPPPPHPPVVLDGLDGRSHTVTLITGDRVSLTSAGGGGYSVSADPVIRPDGSTPTLTITTTGRGLYALPDDAAPYTDAGLLDKELFNVEYLAANGYTDEATTRLPVIVEYAEQPSAASVAREAGGLAASARTATLESIDAAGVSVEKAGAGAFWASLVGDEATAGVASRAVALPGGIERVWLDRLVRVDLEQSVPQIGAPQAWAAGYDGTGVKAAVIDTGVDPTHPDLAGRVVASRSFIAGEEVDGHGHGTHVASTVAGAGTASGGRYKGVAPGAQLVIAKALSNAGIGPTSGIIEAMEWVAIDQQADVVSMSLGCGPSDGCSANDGTDPMSRAVDELTAATGALFVVSAGNDGPGSSSVGTPGVAAAALTVGAVDKSETLAGFSARGPRSGDYAIKPEITGPGVSIVAARAAGTSMGSPVDDHYTTADGTSMATPHVAGAAAILAQQHPDWNAEQLKATLVATAADGGYTVYEQGGGRVDVARASAQQVQVSPATADFGFLPWPQEGSPVTRTLTYTNPTAEPVILDLVATAETVEGTPVPDGVLTIDPESVALTAGGTATVAVSLDHTAVDSGLHTGRITATNPDGTRLSTPVGFAIDEQRHTLRVRVIGHEEHRRSNAGGLSVYAVDGSNTFVRVRNQNPAVVSVAAGTYSVARDVSWYEGTRQQYAQLFDPEVIVDGDTEIVLDAGAAERVTIDTPMAGEALDAHVEWQRSASNGEKLTVIQFFSYGHFNVWATPTEPVTTGGFRYASHWVLGAPPVTMAVTRPKSIELHPVYSHPLHQAVQFSGNRKIPVVYVGAGGAADYVGRDVRGRLVLLRNPNCDLICNLSPDQLNRAIAAGAAGVLFHPGTSLFIPAAVIPPVTPRPNIPFVSLPATEADMLVDLLGRGRVEMRVKATPETPYLYQIKPYEDGRIPDSLRYRFTNRDLAVVDDHFHAAQPSPTPDTEQRWRIFRPGDPVLPFGLTVADSRFRIAAPRTLRQYVGPLYPDATHQRVTTSGTGRQEWSVEAFRRPGAGAEVHWHAGPQVPGAPAPPTAALEARPGATWHQCAGCRQGDTFYPVMHPTTPEAQHRGAPAIGALATDPVHLYRNGQEIPQSAPYLGIYAGYRLPAESTSYRLTVDHQDIHTAWQFTSSTVTRDKTPDGYACTETFYSGSTTPCRAEPLIFLRYDADVSLANTVRAAGAHQLRVTAYHQAPHGPRIAGLRLWVSTDGGARWRSVDVRSLGHGQYRATVDVPKLDRTSGTVGIKAEAWDTDGNRVYQTVYDAYRIR